MYKKLEFKLLMQPTSASGKLVVDAFLFSSRTNLSFLGSDDKDVKVSFVGGSGDDTLTTGKYTASPRYVNWGAWER